MKITTILLAVTLLTGCAKTSDSRITDLQKQLADLRSDLAVRQLINEMVVSNNIWIAQSNSLAQAKAFTAQESLRHIQQEDELSVRISNLETAIRKLTP